MFFIDMIFERSEINSISVNFWEQKCPKYPFSQENLLYKLLFLSTFISIIEAAFIFDKGLVFIYFKIHL